MGKEVNAHCCRGYSPNPRLLQRGRQDQWITAEFIVELFGGPGRLFTRSVDDLHHRASQHGVKYEPQVFVRRSAEVCTAFVCRRNPHENSTHSEDYKAMATCGSDNPLPQTERQQKPIDTGSDCAQIAFIPMRG